MKIKGYNARVRNWKNFKKMGGVATAVKNSLNKNAVKIKEGEKDNEYMITRLGHTNPAINIINVYGGIEERMEDQEVIENWGRLNRDLDDIQSRNESVVMLGDFNRAIWAGEQGVEGNKPKVSKGGKLIRELLEEGEYILANNSKKASGGPWTWVCRGDGKVRSCLDLVIISADLEPFLQSLVVDTEFEFGPARIRKVQNKLKKIYSDHFPVIVKLKNLPTRKIKTQTVSHWNLNVPEGLKTYKALSDNIADKMNKVIENKSLSIEEVKKKTDALQNKVKFQAFGKTKPATATAKKRWLEERKEATTGMDDEEARKILHIQSQTIEDEINKIKSGRHGRVTNVFKMRELVAGSKKQKQEAHAVKDTKTGKTVVSCEEIRRVNLEHCVNVLKNNTPKPEVEVLLKCQSELHDMMMKEETDKDATVTEEEYNEVVSKFKKKNKKSYFFLT